MRGDIICRDKSYTVQSVINKTPPTQNTISVYIILDKCFSLSPHSEYQQFQCLWKHHRPPPEPTQALGGSENERRYSRVCVIQYNVTCVCVCVCVWSPPIHTDCRWTEQTLEKQREIKKGRAGREVEKRTEGRIQPPCVSLSSSPSLSSFLSPSYCIYNALSV